MLQLNELFKQTVENKFGEVDPLVLSRHMKAWKKETAGNQDVVSLQASIAEYVDKHIPQDGDVPITGRLSQWARELGISSKDSCPYCSGLKVWRGFNDLATKHPELVLEWDYERNGDLIPEQVSEHSHTQVFWKCRECGASWCVSVGQRVSYGTGCPACKNMKKLSKRIL